MAVDVVSGIVSLTCKDILIPGKFPLAWKRRYSTAHLENATSPLGQGWTGLYFSKLTRMAKDWHFLTPDGGWVVFPDPKDELEHGKVLRDPGSYHEIAQSGFYIKVTHWDVESHEVTRYVFQPARHGRLWPLQSIEDVTGQGLDIAWDDRGLLKGVRQRLEKRTLVVHHDGAGNLASVAFLHTDGRLQNLVRYQYDGKGMLCAATDATEKTERYEYDRDGRISRELARDGAIFSYKYDDGGRCIRTWGIDNYDLKVIRYFDNSAWSEVVDSYGNVRRYHRLATCQIDQEINPLGGIRLTEYDEFGRTRKTIDPLGAETSHFYDESGNREKTVDALGNATVYRFNSDHQAIAFMDAKGNEWTKKLDENGRLKATRDPGGGVWEYDYDEHGNPVEVRDPLGPKTRLGFGPTGDLAEVLDWEGRVTKYRCDAFGRIVRFEAPSGKITLRSFDALGRLVAIEESDEKYAFRYNAKNMLLQTRDSKGRIFKRVYGTCGRLLERIDADGKSVKYIWGSEPGRLLKLINAQGATYEFTYDAAGNKIRERAFDGRVTLFKRDVAGNCIETGDGAGNRILLAYDKKGQVVSKTFPDGTSVSFAYDLNGLLEMADNPDCRLEFLRDAMGRVIEEVQGDHTLHYEYDVSGNLLRVETDKGMVVAYGYGDTGSLAQVVHNGKNMVGFRNEGSFGRTCRDLPGAATLSHAYDPGSRTLSQIFKNPGGTGWRRDFGFAEEGRLTSVLDSIRGLNRYLYDPAGNLSESHFHSGEQDRFEYDEAGHLTRMNLAGREQLSLEYRSPDRISKRGRENRSYDAAGRLESIWEGDDPETSQKWTLHWDAMDQLRKVVKPDGETWTYQYDPLGRRISKLGPPGRTRFLWDRHVVVQNIGPGNASGSWVYGPSGFVPIGKETEGKFYSIITDHLGTPVDMVDGNGTIAWSATYHPFGEMLRGERSGTDCEVRFPGQWHDAETGFHYNRFRYYDPLTGSYISQDPIGLRGGMNPYAYGGDPLNWIDPFGLAMLYRGMKKDANGQPVVYSGEGGGGQNAADSLGVRPVDDGKMSTNTDPANIQPHRKPKEFGGTKSNDSTALYAIDSDVLAQHGLVHDPDHDTHVAIKVAPGIDPESLPERLAATKEHWKPVTKDELDAKKEAEKKKDGGCNG